MEKSFGMNMEQYKTYLTEVKHHNNRYFFLGINGDIETLNAKPGQFFQLKIPNSDSALLRLPISIHSIQNQNLEFMIKKIGYGTECLSKLKSGEIIDLIGPLGNGFELTSERKCLLVSGGIGYAPLFYLKQKLMGNKNEVTWLHGGRDKNEVFEADLIYTDDGSKGRKGFVTEGLKDILSRSDFDMIYCCGPEIMMEKCVRISEKFKIDIQVSLEEYMACGIGACYGCVVPIKEGKKLKYKRVCKDGPIFWGNQVVWNE